MNILITGAAQGIGASISKFLSSKENVLILVDINQDKLKDISNQLRSSCKDLIELCGDLTDKDFVTKIKKYITDNPIDVLVNNAGYAHQLNNFSNLSENDFDISFLVNVKAPFHLIQTAIPEMKKRGSGIILNIASRANIYGYNKMGIYSATKAALTSFSGTIALENPEIKSITIIPGRTNTSMQVSLRGEEEAAKAQSPDYVGEVISKIIKQEIQVESGESVLIDFNEYKVLKELNRSDLHKNIH